MERLLKTYPLVCPFCDEPAEQVPKSQRKITAHKIYTPRRCTMGHIVWSVEEIPEDQSAIVEELKTIREVRHAEKLEQQLKKSTSQTDI